jgi:hypothetical protein
VVFLDEHVHELDPLHVREITMGVLQVRGAVRRLSGIMRSGAGLSVELERPWRQRLAAW